jgi:hypothetical protein
MGYLLPHIRRHEAIEKATITQLPHLQLRSSHPVL